LAFSSPTYTRNGGTCTATLTPAVGTCTIIVRFRPTVSGAVTATLTINGNVAVTGSPVSLSGTGFAPVIAATLTPTTNAFGTAARGVSVANAPTQMFTLTNTGNVTLTGIGQGTLTGTNPAEFSVVLLTSTCGPATGGQLVANVTLAPGATCAVTVQFKPLVAPQTIGAKSANLRVNSAAGAKLSTLTGTAQ
jgi:hypothetical protein